MRALVGKGYAMLLALNPFAHGAVRYTKLLRRLKHAMGLRGVDDVLLAFN